MSAFLSFLSLLLWTQMQSEAEVFDTSSNNEYENSMITCMQSSCQIICDTPFGCSKTSINANLSDTLTISCLANNACSGMNIISGAQISTTIGCTDVQSCRDAIFNVGNSENVNLTCNYPTNTDSDNGTCYKVTLNADTSTNVEVNCHGGYNCNDLNIHTANVVNALNLTCDGYYQCVWTHVYCPLNTECNIKCSDDAFSCSYMDIYIENVNSDINIECPGANQYECSGTEIHCGGTLKTSSSELYYDGKSSFGCHMDGCCPPSFYGATTTCTAHEQCIVDCASNDCSKYIIDGTAASSLTVTCNPTLGGGCGAANILCPTTANAQCTVDCQGNRACYQSFIKAADSYSLQIDCKGTESCETMAVNCPSSVNNDNGGCVVNCDGSNSCHDGSIKATGSYSLDLVCKGYWSCFGLGPIYCPYNRVNACNIDCSNNDDKICYGMIFYADDEFVIDYVDLKCPGTNTNDACGNQLFVCIADGSTDKSSAWMVFNDEKSLYQCDEPNNSDNCCPWINVKIPTASNPTTVTVNPSNTPSQNPSEVTINPTMFPSVSPTQPTSNPSAVPSKVTDSPATYTPTMTPTTSQPTDADVHIDHAVYSELSVLTHMFVLVLLVF